MVIAIYLVILVAAFFFLIVRPQRRQAQIRKQLLDAVRVGDEIVTSGGIHAVVVSLDDDTVEVSIAPGVEVTLARGAIAGRLSAPGLPEADDETPDAADAAGDDDDEA